MNKRGILALLMAVMMLIISVPASAATIYVPAEVEVTLPEEGATMTSDQLYRALKPSVPGSVIDFQFYDNDAFGAKLATIGNGIIGATISAHVTYVGPDAGTDGVLAEYDLVDVPICGLVMAGSGGSARLGFTLDDLIAHSNGAITSKTSLGNYVEGFTNDQGKWQPYHTMTNIVLKAGTAPFYNGQGGQTYVTDPFPENTVFVSAANFTVGTMPSSGINKALDWGGYTIIGQGGGHTLFFKAKESGTYDLWALTSSHSSSTYNRTPVVKTCGITATVPTDHTAYGDRVAIWAKTDGQVTLTAGQVVSMVVDCPEYGRFGGFAFVPADAEDKPTANFKTVSGTEGCISNADLMNLQDLTTEKATVGEDVAVTVDGVEVTATFGAAAKVGASSDTVDVMGNAIVNTTVSDALVSASKLPAATGTKVLAYLNGAKVVNPGITFVKDGDVITTQVVSGGFDPAMIDGSTFFNGIYDGGSGKVHMLFTTNFIGKRIDADYKNTKPLDGAHLNGYITPRLAGTTMKLGTMDGYTLFRNQEIVSTNYEYINQDKTQESVEIYSLGTVTPFNADASVQVKDAEGNIIGIHPDRIRTDYYCYEYATLYITDKYTTGETIVIDNGDHKLVSVDGADDLFIIIKNADGSIASTAHRLVTWETPYGLTLEAGQKAYVWRYTNYFGTNMKPLCEVIE